MIKMNQGINKRPTGQKIVILTMFIILGLDFIGMFSDMLIDETLMLNFVLMGAVTSFILFAAMLYYYFKQNSNNRTKKVNSKSPLFVISSAALGAPLLCIMATVKGLPLVLHYITSTQATLTVTVSAMPPSYYSKHCKGRVYLEEYSYFLNDHLCGINKSEWETMLQGDNIILTGQKSPYGFTYSHYKKAKNV